MKIRLFALLFALPGLAFSADPTKKAFDDPANVDEDYAFQGEYTGMLGDEKFGVQIIAMGAGKFRAVGCPGGLPGDGWIGEKPRSTYDGAREEDKVTFTHEEWSGVLQGGKITVTNAEGQVAGTLERVERKSSTLGAKPPEGAAVLFDGTSVEGWKPGQMTEDGLLMQGAKSVATFGDFSLHIEFRLPYQPTARGQGRGNSGLYLQGRYEVQMLDSFGLSGKDNECGGVYKIAEPAVNMCYPPLQWQTYDVDFTAAKFNDAGEKTANARTTIRHNGVVIHDNLELPNRTGGAQLPNEQGPGPVFLQNHGNPVRYRNIWVAPK